MSVVKLGKGSVLESYLNGVKPSAGCECNRMVREIIDPLTMCGGNISWVYTGPRCQHGHPSSPAAVAYIVDNYHGETIKVKDKSNITSWLNTIMKGSVALVFFRSNGTHGASALDLYLGDKLWINSGVHELADEMWVWCMGSPRKVLKKHKTKSHHKAVHMF